MGCSASSQVTGGSTPASGPRETPPVQVASKTSAPNVDPAPQSAQENPQPEIVREHSGHKDEQKQDKEVAVDDPQNSSAEPREDPLGEESREGFNETLSQETPPQVTEGTEPVDSNNQAEEEDAAKHTEVEKHEEAIEESAGLEPQQKPELIEEGEESLRAEETTKETSPGDASAEEKPQEIQEGESSEEKLVDDNKQDGAEQNNGEHDEPVQVETADKSVESSNTAEEEPQEVQEQNEGVQNSEELKPEEETPASQTS